MWSTARLVDELASAVSFAGGASFSSSVVPKTIRSANSEMFMKSGAKNAFHRSNPVNLVFAGLSIGVFSAFLQC